MYDPELQYCLTCDDEYRADITHCAVCEKELISGKERIRREEERRTQREQRSMEFSPGDELVTIFRGDSMEIKALQDILKNERIASMVTGDEESCGKKCRPTTLHLQVRRQEAEEALKHIQDRYHLSTGLADYDKKFADEVFDQQKAEAICPACGHCFATSQTTCPDCGLCLG